MQFIPKKMFSKEAKASIVYTMAAFLSKAIALITMPIFTRIMTTQEMGIVTLYGSWYAMTSAIVSLALTSGGVSIAMKDFKDDRDRYLSSVLSLMNILVIFSAVLYLILRSAWENLTGLSSVLSILLLLGLFVSPAYELWLAKQRYEYKYISVGILTVLTGLLPSLVSIFAVVIARHRELTNIGEIRVLSTYLVSYAFCFGIWIYLMLKGRHFIDFHYWKYSLKLSVPLVGNSIASQVLSVSDRSMISKLVNDSAVGVYGVLYTISSIPLMLWSAINTSFVPYMYENMDEEKKIIGVRKVAIELLCVFAGGIFLISLFAPEIVKIFASKSEYYDAIYIIPPIAAGVFFISIANLYSNVLLYYKKTYYIMIGSIIAASLNVFLNFIFIPKYGYFAAAYTTLFSYIVLAAFQMLVSSRIYKRETKENRLPFVYNNKLLIFVSMICVGINLMCIYLYRYMVVRWVMFLVIIGVAFVIWRKIKNEKDSHI